MLILRRLGSPNVSTSEGTPWRASQFKLVTQDTWGLKHMGLEIPSIYNIKPGGARALMLVLGRLEQAKQVGNTEGTPASQPSGPGDPRRPGFAVAARHEIPWAPLQTSHFLKACSVNPQASWLTKLT